MENWKQIVGFEGYYEVSDLGRIRSSDRIVEGKDGKQYHKPGIVLKISTNKRGYHQVNLSINGKACTYEIHRLVAKSFIQNSEGKPDVNHKDGVKINNAVCNLEWVTESENTRHAFANGLMKVRYGVETSQAKLNPESVDRVKNLRKSGHTYKAIAKLLGVSENCIWNVTNGKTWKHLTDV